MALTFIARTSETVPKPAVVGPTRARRRGHSKALAVDALDLSKPGWLRAGHLMTLFSISHSTLYNRIHAGLIPKADGDDEARPAWKTSTIKHALERKQANKR